VVITRLRHPLEGVRLRMLGQMRRHGRLELLLVLPDGSKSLIPAGWTDLEPGTVDAGPATVGSRGDLGQAATVVAELLRRERSAQVQAARHPSGQEDHHAACTAEFAAGPDTGATDASRSPARGAGRLGDHRVRPADRQRRDGDARGGRR
jgi:hypothetical protein